MTFAGDSAVAIFRLQTRRLETRSSFSDRVRRELSNGGSVAQFRSRNEKIDVFAIIATFGLFSAFLGCENWTRKSGKLEGSLGKCREA